MAWAVVLLSENRLCDDLATEHGKVRLFMLEEEELVSLSPSKSTEASEWLVSEVCRPQMRRPQSLSTQ